MKLKYKILVPLLFCAAITQGQNIITVAGNHTPGFGGDSGQATAAELDFPRSVAFGPSGDCYIADASNNCIRKVSPMGVISTVAGSGLTGYTGDGAAATAAQFNNPWAVVLDKAGNMYVADAGNNVVRKIDTAGIISTVAGNGYGAGTSYGGYTGDGAPATAAELFYPIGLAIDTSGSLFIADYQNNAIRKVDAGGLISTVAGTGTAGYTGDGAAATAAELNLPSSITFDRKNTLYFTDLYNNVIRKIDATGTIQTIIGNGFGAGTGGGWYSGDGGPATLAELAHPFGLAIDTAGNIYFSDLSSYHIRKVGANDTIVTIAGNGTDGYSGDGGPATAAQISYVYGIALNSSGSLLVADAFNHVIRKIGSPADLGVATAKNGNHIVEVYPNPSSNIITVVSPCIFSTLCILNLAGEVVFSRIDCQAAIAHIDVSAFAPGTYFVSIDNETVKEFEKH